MKKIILFLALIALLGTVSAASVDSVSFSELPGAWETDSALDFKVNVEGSGLETIIFQSRRPGEPGFRDRRIKECTNYASCSWNFEHSESNRRSYEYRFRVYAGGDRQNSRYQTVRYYDNLNYYVDWVSTPPETASSGDSVEMSVSSYDSAGRFDREGGLKLQYRSDSGTWETFDERDCSKSSDENRCSNWGATELKEEKVQSGEADFRGKIVFDGGVSSISQVRTVSVSSSGEQSEVDSVSLGDLPEEVQKDSGFRISAEASGNQLDRIIIQERNPEDPGWSDWRTQTCIGDFCSFSRNYHVEDTGEKEFRARAWAGSDAENSGTQTVDFVAAPVIESVSIDDLPSTHPEETDLDISGQASGNELDRLRLLKRQEGSIDWREVKEVDCSGSSCSISKNNFQASKPGEVSFKIRAYAGSENVESGIENVEFTSLQDEERVDSVNLDNLPDQQETRAGMAVTGGAEGENLDRIILQKRDPGGNWERLTSQECGNDDSCDFSYNYNQNDAEEVDFRLEAEAGGDNGYSNIDTVQFVEDSQDDRQVDNVNIDDLPTRNPLNQDLRIEGSASGNNLERMWIQKRDDGGWNLVKEKSCSGSSCSITKNNFRRSSAGEVDFRVKAEAGSETDASGIETVSFYRPTGISSVTLDDVSSSYETDTNLELSGTALGSSLDSLTLQGRREGSIEIFNIKSVSCSGSSCSITKNDFRTSRTGEIMFRLRARAGSDTGYSSTEVVDFYQGEPDPEVNSVSIDGLPSTHPTGESLSISGQASGTALERITIEYRNQGSSSWTEYRSQSCSESSCSITRSYTAGSEEETDFRVKIYAGSISSTSNVETVSFEQQTSPSVDSVSINNLPPNTETGTDIQIEAEASGTNLESITIQRRNGGSWADIQTSSCSGGACSLSTDFSTSTTGDIDFRARAVAGTDSGVSTVETVTFTTPPPQGEVNSVSIENLPDRHPVENSLYIEGEASGTGLDSIKVQRRVQGGNWNEVETESCTGSSCSISTTYSRTMTGEVDFRIRAGAGSDTGISTRETVEFIRQEQINSVDLGNLPNSYPVRTNLGISGSASGVKLDSLALLKRNEGSINWQIVENVNCSNQGSCSLNLPDYRSEKRVETAFKIRAKAGERTQYSETRVVVFTPIEDEYMINNIDLQAPNEANTSENIWLNASATGSNLDEIFIQRDVGPSWSNLKQNDCNQQDTCLVNLSYSSSVSGDQDFRAKVYAGSKSENSDKETITFNSPPETPDIVDIDINSLPSMHPTGENLEISGSAEGNRLQEIRIQKREEGTSGWTTIRMKDCNEQDTCHTSTAYSSQTEKTEEFRTIAFIENSNSTSNTENVEFGIDEEDGGPDVNSVKIEDLPSRYRSGRDLDMSANASGIQLDSLSIQKRQEGSIDWENIAEEQCINASSCSLTRENFEGSGQVTFRARAVAGTDVDYSGLEVVEFHGESVDGEENDARLHVIVEDEEDEPIEDARVEARNGDEEIRRTDDSGQTSMLLEPGDYTVEVSKDGYETEEKNTELEEDGEKTLRFELREDGNTGGRDVRIISVNSPNEVCRGREFIVNAVIENSGDSGESFAVQGSGLGGASSQVVDIDEDEVEQVSLTFEGVESTGLKDLTVHVENGDEDQRTRLVKIKSCDTEEIQNRGPTGLTAKVTPQRVIVGEDFQVKGDVTGTSSPQELEIKTLGETRRISSNRDGSYQAFFTPESVGTVEVKISSSGFTRRRTVEVIPRAEITGIDMPRKTFEDDRINACAQVNTQIDAKVILERDGRFLATKHGQGRICFNVKASEPGRHTYRFRALTYGTGSSAEKTIEILKDGEEFQTFPGRIATVNTEPGIAKVTIYNKRNSTTAYNVDMSGIDERWVSSTDKQKVLPKGGKGTVFFYFTPRNTGSYSPEVRITSDGREIYSQEISIRSSSPTSDNRISLIEAVTSGLDL